MKLCSTTLPLVITLVSTTVAQSTWYVDVSGTAPGVGTPGSPYTSLQYALDQPSTVNGDLLLVAAGHYLESVDFRGKALVVDGSAATTTPVIDAASAARVLTFASGEGPTTVLRSLVVTGGLAPMTSVGGRGGGVLIDGASPRFEGVVFEGCRGTLGGGVAVRNGSPSFVDCMWRDNEAMLGGALHVESATVTLVRGGVVDNRARGGSTFGGGIMLAGGASADIDSTTFEQNSTRSFGGGGGAIASDVTSTGAVVRDALFRANVPGDGFIVGFGAAIFAQGPLQAMRCTFIGNGGAAAFDSTLQGGACHGGDYIDCTFSGNGAQFGGALYQGTALRCDFLQNEACADGSGAGGAAVNSQLVECRLVGNWACGEGGGARNCTLTDCEVIDNRAVATGPVTAGHGGGLHGGSATGTLLRGNQASSATSGAAVRSAGGGAYGSTLMWCVLLDNRADVGGGAAMASTLTDCEVRFNRATGGVPNLAAQGGGLYLCTAVRTHIHGNEARHSHSPAQLATGGGAYNCTLHACVVTCNRAELGGGLAYPSSSTLIADRVTVLGNTATLQGSGVDGGTYRSSLVWHNFGVAIGGSASFAYCNVQTAVPGVGNLSANPLVMGPAGSDARLRAGSPCIDAGDPSAPPDPDGSRADIGALPYDPTTAPAPDNYCRPTRPLAQPACLPVIVGVGAASLSGAGSLSIDAHEVTPGQLGLLLLGFTPAALPFALSPSLEGTICIGPAFVRGRIQSATPGAACAGTFHQPLPAGFLTILGLQAGDRLHAQFWYRAAGATALTDALEIPIVP